MAGTSYSIRKNRIRRGYYPGFTLMETGELVSTEAAGHYLYLRAIDSGITDSLWGRLWFELECREDMVSYVYVAALNEDSFYRNGKPVRIEDFLCDGKEPDAVKKEFFRQIHADRFVNKNDLLLYGLKGRYLYIAVEILGEGFCRLDHMRVDLRGDNFMDTFPEIYRERNSFFHRFMSVFSSIYNDFLEDIDGLPGLLDLDTCPVELLPVYASWMGLDVGNDFLEEQPLRALVKEAYRLNRMKGTRAALERIASIVLGKEVLVLERNMMADYIESPHDVSSGHSVPHAAPVQGAFLEKEQLEELERLYGSSIYDVTILVGEMLSEVKKSQLMFLLEQFKPVRSRLHIICLKKTGRLDAYSYLDMNARIPEQGDGRLDASQELDGAIRLE